MTSLLKTNELLPIHCRPLFFTSNVRHMLVLFYQKQKNFLCTSVTCFYCVISHRHHDLLLPPAQQTFLDRRRRAQFLRPTADTGQEGGDDSVSAPLRQLLLQDSQGTIGLQTSLRVHKGDTSRTGPLFHGGPGRALLFGFPTDPVRWGQTEMHQVVQERQLRGERDWRLFVDETEFRLFVSGDFCLLMRLIFFCLCQVRKEASAVIISLDFCLPLSGDIKMEFFQRSKLRKVLQFRFWFNTFFLDESTTTVPDTRTDNDSGGEDRTVCLTFAKKDLDIVCKKDKEHKVYKADFKVGSGVKNLNT